MRYIVKCHAESENSFVALSRYDVIIDFVGHDDDNNEIYEIETEYDIDRLLDLNDGIMTYDIKR